MDQREVGMTRREVVLAGAALAALAGAPALAGGRAPGDGLEIRVPEGHRGVQVWVDGREIGPDRYRVEGGLLRLGPGVGLHLGSWVEVRLVDRRGCRRVSVYHVVD